MRRVAAFGAEIVSDIEVIPIRVSTRLTNACSGVT